MSSLNKVMLIGRVGRDPEVRRLNSGEPVVSFSLATSEAWRDKATGERKERTEWHDVVIFNEGLAKVAETYVRKGGRVYVEGEMQTRQWEDRNTGEKRRKTEVVLTRYRGALVLLGEKTGATASHDDDGQGDGQAASPAPSQAPLDDDIAF